MKKLSIFAILMLAFIISSACFAAGSYHVTQVNVTMTAPARAEYAPTDLKATGYNSTLEVTNIAWKNPKGEVMGEKEIFIDGTYTLAFTLTRVGGDALSNATNIYLNGEKVEKTYVGPNTYGITKEFNINGSPITGRLSNASGVFNPATKVKIKNIDFSLPVPAFGAKPATESDLVFNDSLKDKIEVEAVTWVAGNEFVASDATFAAGVEYEVRVFVKAASGYQIEDDAVVTFNGEKSNFRKVNTNEFRFDKTYEALVGQRPSTSTGSRPSRPTTGSSPSRPSTSLAPSTTVKPETTPSDSHVSPALIEAIQEAIAEGLKPSGDVEISEIGDRPIVSRLPIVSSKPTVTFRPGTGISLATDSGEKEETTSPKPSTPSETDKKWVNEFSVTVPAPKIGEKPSTEVKPVSKGFKVTKVTWTPSDKEFKEGVSYTVKAMLAIEDGYDLRSDYFALVNGLQGDMPQKEYDKNNFYLEYTWRPLHKPVNWASASKWAVEELQQAKEADIIPVIFDKEDLTQNITRKEFAHVAVLLYEKVSGLLAKPVEKNPFTDTKDEEILKAYNVGITKGMSETTFEPETLITREQMATMMTRALSEAGVDVTLDKSKIEKFSDDANISSWATDSVYFMANAEIIKGMGDGSFGAKGNATREQSLLISNRSVAKFSK